MSVTKNLTSLLMVVFAVITAKVVYNTFTQPDSSSFPLTTSSVIREGESSRAVTRDAIRIPSFDMDVAINRLSRVIQFPTINYDEEKELFEKMWSWIKEDGFRELFLKDTNGLSHCHEIPDVATKGKLIKCPAKRKSKKSILLTSHLDVVPIHDASKWTYPPFSGAISEGYLWGRGTLDDKTGVIGVLEALEYLYVKEEWRNQDRDIYVAVGMDEEIGGDQGAKEITEYLLKQKEEFSFVLDEGGVISDAVPNLSRDVSLIAVAEKGDMTIQLTVIADGGHSSYPKHPSAVGILSEALAKLERNKVPSRPDNDLMIRLLENVAPYSKSYLMKVAIANRWLFKSLIERVISSKPQTDAGIRTTTAVTMVKAGVKVNVVPSEASAVVNFRLAPGDTVESIIEFVKKTINDDRISVEIYKGDGQMKDGTKPRNPSPISCVDCNSYEVLRDTTRSLFPNTVVSPYLFIAGSDSKHYRLLSSHAYGFIPYHLYESRRDFQRIHGIDERIGITEYREIVEYYYVLIRNLLQHLKDE